VFWNPRVLLLGAIGFIGNGAGNGFILSAPAVLAADTGLDTARIGTLVSAGGILGIVCILFAGWMSDRSGDRLGAACACAIIVSGAVLLIGVGATPRLVVIGYLLFAATFFTGGMLVIASWADVLPVNQLAVGAAAINTLWQIGNFLSPYAWGIVADATGTFRAGLSGASVLAAAEALLIWYVRSRVLSERRGRLVPVGAA
jgi:ACS family tartrate transporter-like MFS transporter